MENNTDNNQSIVHRTSLIINRFHYLTQDLAHVTHQQLAETACQNGIRWLQLRIKNKPFEEYLQIAKEVKVICEYFKCTLIINDHVEICKAIDADGVHLGKMDMPIPEARKILGAHKIIGGTANTLEDVIVLEKNGVDYIGLGPYRFTNTKENLAPVLGIESYSAILQFCNSTIPIIAIGGIQLNDVKPIMNTGIYGIAVSSAINLSNNKAEAIGEFLALVS